MFDKEVLTRICRECRILFCIKFSVTVFVNCHYYILQLIFTTFQCYISTSTQTCCFRIVAGYVFYINTIHSSFQCIFFCRITVSQIFDCWNIFTCVVILSSLANAFNLELSIRSIQYLQNIVFMTDKHSICSVRSKLKVEYRSLQLSFFLRDIQITGFQIHCWYYFDNDCIVYARISETLTSVSIRNFLTVFYNFPQIYVVLFCDTWFTVSDRVISGFTTNIPLSWRNIFQFHRRINGIRCFYFDQIISSSINICIHQIPCSLIAVITSFSKVSSS